MTDDTNALLIDALMPAWDVSIAEHLIVRAEPPRTFAAARGLDFVSVHTPILTVAMWARGLPDRLTGHQAAAPPRLVLTAGDELPGWVVLGERTARELAFGAVGRFWQPNITWHDVPAEEFAAFAEPGWGKIVASFSVVPYGEHATLLTYECRTTTTDADSRRRFAALLVAGPAVRRPHLPGDGGDHPRRRRRRASVIAIAVAVANEGVAGRHGRGLFAAGSRRAAKTAACVRRSMPSLARRFDT